MNDAGSRETIRALGIAGSLRRGSYNRKLLRAAREPAPEPLEVTIFENETPKRIPPFALCAS